jgi:bifunctional DNase/RNase
MAGALLVLTFALAGPLAAKKRDGERVEVDDVIATSDGHYVVILRTKAEPVRFLPIWIGESEAMAIRMRLDRRTPPRPLTLNLLEKILATSKIKLIEVKVDSLKGGVFLGKLRLRQSGRAWEVDARPSDAIGLAAGSGASIWVARQVLEQAAIGVEELKVPSESFKPPETAPSTESKSTDYEETL